MPAHLLGTPLLPPSRADRSAILISFCLDAWPCPVTFRLVATWYFVRSFFQALTNPVISKHDSLLPLHFLSGFLGSIVLAAVQLGFELPQPFLLPVF